MSTIAQVRVLIPDTTEPYMFSDDEITSLLELNDADAHFAAAQALEILASKFLLDGGGTKVRTDDLTLDPGNTVEQLLDRATSLRENATGDAFVIVYPHTGAVVPEATARPW